MVVTKVSTETAEYKIGFVDGYNKAINDYKTKHKSNIVHCKDCKWWSKAKLKCYKPYANRSANGNSFCDKAVLKNV